MVKCSDCGKEIEASKAVKLKIDGKEHYFHAHHVRNISQKFISKVVLNKTFAEIIALVTGLGGIIFTIQDVAEKALLMHTLSVIAAITALLVGIEHLRYVREHNLVKRVVLFTGLGILIVIIILVWYFGF